MLLKTICAALLLTSAAQAVAIEREGGVELERRAGCPRGKYMDSKGACLACSTVDKDASACSLKAGATKVEVLACKTKFLSPSKSCTSTCPRGYAGADHKCTPCSSLFPNSLLCTATAATSCPYPYYVSQITGKCAPACEEGYFGPIGPGGAPRACQKCSSKYPNSLTCNFYTPMTCKDGFDVYSGACVPSCPATLYHGDDGNCAPCPQSNALTCNAWEALSCEPGFQLYGSHCIKTSTFSNGPYSLMKHTVIGGQIYPEDQTRGYDLSDCAALCTQVAAPFLTWINAAPEELASCWCADQTDITNMWVGDWAPGTLSVTYSMSKELTCAEVAAAVPDNTFATDNCVDVTFTDGVCARISDGGECYAPLDL
ncbi:hypothetical protein BCR35DRAFT_350580 [Leucosporidium creatinivorum]|uniref:Insulin-like growth factor binding protein n=1 Tax=Leucosporidium creatinivorum TaxID=106004 RepID=A0A1Y2G0A5_9BASI|nr:hypothetical protein BCR35DRAFT_350580 [Leucosporidium creatinivorum]